jgi:hypothetical protein
MIPVVTLLAAMTLPAKTHLSIKRGVIIGAVFVAVATMFLVLRAIVFHGWISEAGARVWQYPAGISRYILPIALAGKYIGLLIMPVQLFADYRWLPAHMSGGPLLGYAAAGLVVLLIIAWSQRKKRLTPVAIGGIWFVFALLPFLQIVYVQSFFAERHLCLALAGGAICLAGIFQDTWSGWTAQGRRWLRVQLAVWVSIWIAALAAQSWARVGQWQTGESLWLDQVRHAPDSVFGLHNLAWYELQDGELAQARIHLDRALRIDPEFGDAWRTRGDLLMRQKAWAAAGRAYQKAANINPTDANSVAGVALAAYARGDFVKARDYFDRAARIDPQINHRFASVIKVLK